MRFDQPPVVRVEVDGARAPADGEWPMTVPAVAQLAREGLDLPPGITFLVGENGSGKSTVVEAVASAFGMSPEGGSTHGHHSTRPTESPLGGALHDLARAGGQVLCATHSPVLASLPGATILELGEWGYRRTAWEDLDLVQHWRAYLAEPQRYLRHVLDD